MFDLNVAADQRRKGLATFLLGEAFDRLRSRGVAVKAEPPRRLPPPQLPPLTTPAEPPDEGSALRSAPQFSAFRTEVGTWI